MTVTTQVTPPRAEGRSDRAAPLAVIRDLRKTYGSLEAVSGVSFSIHPGEVLGLVGPNGAGKTTVISILATARRPSAGDVRVLGYSITKDAVHVRRAVGLVPQDVAIYPALTAAENVRYFGRLFDVKKPELLERTHELLGLVGLSSRADDRAGTFSGGMKRRLNIAMSLIHSPEVILLDEPTVGVDPQSREHIFGIVQTLRERGRAVLYTTHYLEEAERLCDRIAVMDAGRIVALGTLQDLLADSKDVIEIRGLPDDARLARLEKAPGVARIERRAGAVRIVTANATRVLAALDELLRGAPADVRIEVERLGLGRYFLELTGESLRD